MRVVLPSLYTCIDKNLKHYSYNIDHDLQYKLSDWPPPYTSKVIILRIVYKFIWRLSMVIMITINNFQPACMVKWHFRGRKHADYIASKSCMAYNNNY